jgi:putative redox protein
MAEKKSVIFLIPENVQICKNKVDCPECYNIDQSEKCFMIYSRKYGVRGKMNEGLTEITAKWQGERSFIAQNSIGASVQIGTFNGKPGVGPMQILLIAVAGCTGDDIVSILQKKRTDLVDMQIRVIGKRAVDFPKIWTQIHISYLLWGRDINPKDVEQAIELSENKYCSVGIMLGKSAKITSEYQILKPGEKTN